MPRYLAVLITIAAVSCTSDDTDAPAVAEPAALFTAMDVDLGTMITGREDVPTILEVNGGGIALFDADGDDDLDALLVVPGEYPDGPSIGRSNRLFANDGGTFVDVTSASGVDVAAFCNGVAIADVDSDGDRDVYLTCHGPNVLLRNDGNLRFTPVADAAGAAGAADDWSTSALFIDLDADGDQDLYVVNYLAFDADAPPLHGEGGLSCLWKGLPVMCGPQGLPPQADRVYINEGGRFVERTSEWGFDGPAAYGLGVIDGDFNGDGVLDVYVTNDSVANFLYLSQPDGTFREGGVLSGAVLSARGREQAGMGVAAGDPDGDGDEDLLVTNFSMESNALYIQSEGGVFSDLADRVGIGSASRRLLGWGVAFLDADLDGDEDVIAANGHVYTQADAPNTDTSFAQPDLLMLNDGAARFRATPWPGEQPSPSRALAVGDLDDDGVTDVVVTQRSGRTQVWRGTAPSSASLQIVLRGDPGNPDDVGALVRWTDALGTQVRRVRVSAGFQAVGDPRPVFAFRGAGTLDVRHADGRLTRGEVTTPGRVVVQRDGRLDVSARSVADGRRATVDTMPDGAPRAGDDASPVPVATVAEDERPLVMAAVRAMGEKRFEQVGEILAPLLARDAIAAEVQYIAGSAAYELQRYVEASERLAQAAALDDAFKRTASALGFARLKLGDHAGARAAFEDVLSVDATMHKAEYGLGLVALDVGTLEEAERHLTRALELSPSYTKARFARARLLERQGDPAAALRELEGVIVVERLHTEALLLAARLLAGLGRDAEAEAMLAQRAQVYAVVEAIGGLRQKVVAGQASPQLFVDMIGLYLSVGAARDAEEVRREALARFPDAAALFAKGR